MRRLLLVPARLELAMHGRAPESVRTLYRPGPALGRAALAVSLALPLGARAAPLPFELPQMLADLGETASSAAIMRSTGRSQWVVAPQRGGEVTSIVKVAIGEQADLLRREADTMSRIARGDPQGFRIPRVLATHADGDLYAVSFERVPRARMRFDLEQALALSIALARVSPSGIVHGDLAPWNILDGAPPWLIDWELADAFVPGVDFAHYVLSSAFLASLLSPAAALPTLASGSGYLARYAEAAAQDVAATEEAVDAYRLRFLEGVRATLPGEGS